MTLYAVVDENGYFINNAYISDENLAEALADVATRNEQLINTTPQGATWWKRTRYNFDTSTWYNDATAEEQAQYIEDKKAEYREIFVSYGMTEEEIENELNIMFAGY